MLKGIVIAGPTAVGKTGISLKLAKILGAEIISADSAQVYRGLDIGTAKITAEERKGIPHHMIDIAEPTEKYSVGAYLNAVSGILREKEKEGKPVLVVGGTGLYIDAVTEGLAELPPGDSELRASFSTIGTEGLYRQLSEKDPEAARLIHPNNRKRIVRALEVCLLTGNLFSVLSRQNVKKHRYVFQKYALKMERPALYGRIEARVDRMLAEGLIEEARGLYKKYPFSLRELNVIGYSEILDYLDGLLPLKEAVAKIKKNSRHYAKRQFTWFKNDPGYGWYDCGRLKEEEIAEDILKKFENVKLDT